MYNMNMAFFFIRRKTEEIMLIYDTAKFDALGLETLFSTSLYNFFF